jgi:hypothetical protein
MCLFCSPNSACRKRLWQLSAKKLDWWLEAEVEQGRKPVVLMHHKPEMPSAFAAIARSLSSSHAFAELRVVNGLSVSLCLSLSRCLYLSFSVSLSLSVSLCLSLFLSVSICLSLHPDIGC